MANISWKRKGPFVTDTINGFRAITREAWKKLALDGPGYTIEYQSPIRAFKPGLRIAEFPTYEASRIDHREGSPSFQTGVAFLDIFGPNSFGEKSDLEILKNVARHGLLLTNDKH
jgi:hypothetical protein